MILKQYYLGCLAHASYLIADQVGGQAVVIDPQRDVEQYLMDAAELGCAIKHVFLTHMHADFIAGHLELRDRMGAAIYLGAQASAEYAFTPMADGDEVQLGAVRLSVLQTPGHSPESISILVFDPDHSNDRPFAVLTGDTLFIGDVGRPDLRAALGWSADRLAAMLYDSLHDKLLTLPDDTLVYPAHGAGSLCGKNLSTDTVSTIGVQRKYNYALQPMSRERFIEIVTADQPETPAYFTYDAVLNARERPNLEDTLQRELQALSLEQLQEAVRGGAQLLDTREPADFEGAHIRGALNIGLGGSYATWCGTLLDPQQPVVLVADPGHEFQAATRLGRIGFDTIAGYLAGGMQQLDSAPELIERTERITAGSLAEKLTAPAPPLLVDVRTAREWSDGHIDEAVNVPLPQLGDRMGELSTGRPLIVYCASGYRSAVAASLLKRGGVQDVTNLVGGFSAWNAGGAAAESVSA